LTGRGFGGYVTKHTVCLSEPLARIAGFVSRKYVDITVCVLVLTGAFSSISGVVDLGFHFQ
jgi:hypothetical protein